MKQILIDLEEFNLRFAKSRKRMAISQIKWLWAQSALFAGLGTYFLLTPLWGGSWWYLLTVAVYYFAAVFFIWRFVPVHKKAVTTANREIATAMIRLRRLHEE